MSVYVFCVIPEKNRQKFGKVTINGQENEIYTIHHQDTAMVVTKVTDEVLPDRKNLFAHQQTISKVMQHYTVIPMSFGNVFHSERDALLIAKHLQQEFEKLLLQLENKIEVGLKIIAKQDWMDRLTKEDPILSEWKAGNKDIDNPATFYDQIHLGERAQNLVLGIERKVEEEIYRPLLELAEAGKQNNTIPGKVVLNAAFLIDRNKEDVFDQKVNDLYELWKEQVEFKYSGPWPAYNFVNIRLRIEGKI
ncbi:GvpL/GvpF family gas vesicle protein [Neobacillus cucumis]|uniref:Gas vesicle protein GvpF n=1 Tax=Neobacillus cucumis TaxID=1740721 RepID=A0A2N5HNR8_9BACI|nr:GvpL/GvpF family gas vesicle protein [Neobacillus cucumis]PLS07160.1 gas vesicle protein GvpF [Neobacillus cucumis]